MSGDALESEWNSPYPEPSPDRAARLAYVGCTRIAWTSGVELRRRGVVIGGSPWKVARLSRSESSFARRLFAAGRAGLVAQTGSEREAALGLLDRGIADPLPVPLPAGGLSRSSRADAKRQSQSLPPPDDVEIIVPVYGSAEPLEVCLASLEDSGLPITVVDDGTSGRDAARIERVAKTHGARLIVRMENGGPGAARQTGLDRTDRAFVAFIDADAVASADWVARLRPLFDDPVVGAVAPRVEPLSRGLTAVELYEETHSNIDMGGTPSRVAFGVPVGWLPTASVIVRRAALSNPAFDPDMRVGEDVDLFWRMSDAGWTVRYAPDVVTHHRVRPALRDFIGRRASYGTGAADLDARHPKRLVPAWLSLSGLSIVAVLSSRRRRVRALALPIAAYEFARQLRVLGSEYPASVALSMTGKSLYNDAFWLGHLLRRDWWPVGWLVLALTPFSRLARSVAVCMMWQPVKEHALERSRLGAWRGIALRMLDDASYGAGVITGAIRRRYFTVITPRVRFPRWPRR